MKAGLAERRIDILYAVPSAITAGINVTDATNSKGIGTLLRLSLLVYLGTRVARLL